MSSSETSKRADPTCTAVCNRCGASVVCKAVQIDGEWLVDGDSIPDKPEIWNPPDNPCRHEELRPTYVNPNPCVVCGALPAIYHDDRPAYCDEHCPEHEYNHDPHRRSYFCNTCDAEAPPDYYRND